MSQGFTIWFTGLSGAGKTTVSRLVEKELRRRKLKVEVLDGDIIRTNLSKGLGYSREDRDTNIRRIAFVSHLLSRNGVAVIVAAISPYRNTRNEARALIGRFVEVFVRCPLDVCIERDVKGLYKKAMEGKIKEFTGVSDPYEEPRKPEVLLETDRESPEISARRVIVTLERLAYVLPLGEREGACAGEEAAEA
jgi:adenylylsulfate kinase